MSNVIQIRDKDGKALYPITDVSCVIGLEEGAVTEAILCWDGASIPVVADIPAGVVVNYNGTDYTGTLAASSDTVGKIYMVATNTPNNYDRYMTFAGNPSYVWENIGDTTIDLTTYVKQTELDQLEAKVDALNNMATVTQDGMFFVDADLNIGAYISIEVSESVPPIPEITTYTPATFDAAYDNDSYVLYRVANNPDLSLEYEEVGTITYNDDICTILGDRACFSEDDTIAVSYTMGSYTSMQIYKDGTLLSTKQLSSDSHYVDLSNDNLAPGFYKARLTDGSSYSNYTYFEVVDTNVSCSVVNGNCVVTFSSSNGAAVYVDFCAQSGDVIARWKLTGMELLKGQAVIDVTELASWQPRYQLTGAYCKVLFQGEYGMVPSAMVASGL